MLQKVKCTFSTSENVTIVKVYKTKWLNHLGLTGVEINDGTYTPIKMINARYENV